jgi:Mg-chelatase subunit ChlD
MHVKAPGIADAGVAGDAQPRAPLDLVTVLDLSGSMSGHKLELLKQAMRFVIDNLGPDDRLSVVSFSSEARRVTRLVVNYWDQSLRKRGIGSQLAELLRGKCSLSGSSRVSYTRQSRSDPSRSVTGWGIDYI